MSVRNALLISATSFTIALATAAAAQAASEVTVKSPTEVQRALTALNRVVDHTKRLIAAKNYSQLPRENMEFNDGSQALERSIATEPSAFKTQLGTVLRRADDESKSLADASRIPDAAKLETMYGQLASTMKQFFSMFPASVQPSPPNLAQEEQEDRAATTGSAR